MYKVKKAYYETVYTYISLTFYRYIRVSELLVSEKIRELFFINFTY